MNLILFVLFVAHLYHRNVQNVIAFSLAPFERSQAMGVVWLCTYVAVDYKKVNAR